MTLYQIGEPVRVVPFDDIALSREEMAALITKTKTTCFGIRRENIDRLAARGCLYVRSVEVSSYEGVIFYTLSKSPDGPCDGYSFVHSMLCPAETEEVTFDGTIDDLFDLLRNEESHA